MNTPNRKCDKQYNIQYEYRSMCQPNAYEGSCQSNERSGLDPQRDSAQIRHLVVHNQQVARLDRHWWARRQRERLLRRYHYSTASKCYRVTRSATPSSQNVVMNAPELLVCVSASLASAVAIAISTADAMDGVS